jgi:hypothetical protein
MSQESQKIAALRDRLALIESTQINENPFKAGLNAIKNFGSNTKSAFKAGVADPAGAKALAPAATKAGEKAALATGAAVARNPGKVAVGSAAAGAAGMAALAGGGAATKPADDSGAPATPGANATPGAPAASGALTPEEQKELDTLAQSFGDSEDPEIATLLKQYSDVKNAALNKPQNVAAPGQPPATAAKPQAGTVAGATQAIPSGAPVNPANPGGATSKSQPTADEAKAALDNGSPRDIAAMGGIERLQQLAGVPAAPGGAATKPAAPATGGTTTTQTNTSVQGELKMGKPSGPITFNGKVVQPGAPEYAAASAALIKAQGSAQNFRSRNDQNVEKNLATSGAPVSQGAANASRSDF